jgi:hypothetical protein
LNATEEADRRWPINHQRVSDQMRGSKFFAIIEGTKAMKREIFISGVEWALAQQSAERDA